jgi:curved DNA-binding protein CbpA
VLGIEPTGTRDRIETAFRAQARVLHPDLPNGSNEKMSELNRAREEALRNTQG